MSDHLQKSFADAIAALTDMRDRAVARYAVFPFDPDSPNDLDSFKTTAQRVAFHADQILIALAKVALIPDHYHSVCRDAVHDTLASELGAKADEILTAKWEARRSDPNAEHSTLNHHDQGVAA